MLDLNSLLVPTDFSPASKAAFRRSLDLVTGEKPLIIVLHVIDPNLANFAAEHGMGEREEVVRQMRARAEKKLAELEELQPESGQEVTVESLTSEGVPFLEIIKKAEDFKVNAIVMGKVGSKDLVEEMFFGSTAERVIRGSKRPVLVLPAESID